MELGYFNGQYIDLNEKVIPIDERGHNFGDGVYEVIRFYRNQPFMLREHIKRLIQSAEAIKLPLTHTIEDFHNLILEAVEKSNLSDCNVYIQITRGIAARNHLFPNVPVSIAMTVRKAKPLPSEMRENGVKAITLPDERWANCWIKSLNLLPNILAKQTAHENGCFEAILIRDQYITEGSSTNVFMIKNGEIITTPLTKYILPGITRIAVKRIANNLNIPFIERHYTREELLQGEEVFLSSTTSEILPVTVIDGVKIGDGKVGPIVKKLYDQFQQLV